MTNADSIYWPLGTYDVLTLKFIAAQNAVDLALYGVQVTLSFAAITLLAYARRHGRSCFTLVCILGLLLSSTICTVAYTDFYLIQFPTAFGTSGRSIKTTLLHLNIILSVTSQFNYILSDIVLAWRAWCLWPQNRLVKAILLFCSSGTIAGAIAEHAWLYWPGLSSAYTTKSFEKFLVVVIPLLTTNAVATLLIGAKFMHYRRHIKGLLGLFMQRSQAGIVLLLLLESGVAYILFWVVDCILRKSATEDPFTGTHIYSTAAHHISGIYPTLVLFATIEGTTNSLMTAQVSQAMRFGGPPVAHDTNMALDSLPAHTVDTLDIGPENSYADSIAGPSGAQSRELDAETSETWRRVASENQGWQPSEERQRSSGGHRPQSNENRSESSEGIVEVDRSLEARAPDTGADSLPAHAAGALDVVNVHGLSGPSGFCGGQSDPAASGDIVELGECIDAHESTRGAVYPLPSHSARQTKVGIEARPAEHILEPSGTCGGPPFDAASMESSDGDRPTSAGADGLKSSEGRSGSASRMGCPDSNESTVEVE